MPNIELDSRSKLGSKNRGVPEFGGVDMRRSCSGLMSSFTGLWKIITILSA